MTPSVSLHEDSRYGSVQIDDVELVRGGDKQELNDDQLKRVQQDVDKLNIGGQVWTRSESDPERGDGSAQDEAARAKAEAEAKAAEEQAAKERESAQRQRGGGSQ